MANRPSSSILAECTTTNPLWALLNNVNGEDPCTMASILGSPCAGGNEVVIPPLKPGSVYAPTDDRCQCSFQAYNLFSACSACQNTDIPATNNWFTLEQWGRSCRNQPLQNFNINPALLAIPSWANAIENDFNITAVLIELGASFGDSSPNISSIPNEPPPSSTENLPPPPSSSSSKPFHPASFGPTTPSFTPSSASTTQTSSPNHQISDTSSSHSSSSKSAIIGGVFGGLGAIILIALIAWYIYVRRSNKRTAASSEFMQSVPPSARLPASAASFPPTSHSRTALRGPSDGEEESLPPFTQGSFNGPVFEKGGYVNVNGNPVTYGMDAPSSSADAYGGMVDYSPYKDSPYSGYRGDDGPYAAAGVGGSGAVAASLPYTVDREISFYEPSGPVGHR